MHRANIAHKECGWKDGDRGGLAEWELTLRKKKVKVCLTSTGLLMEGVNRPPPGPIIGRSDLSHNQKEFIFSAMASVAANFWSNGDSEPRFAPERAGLDRALYFIPLATACTVKAVPLAGAQSRAGRAMV